MIVAPSTIKLAPGSVWNTGMSNGLVTQSCAQAARALNASAVALATGSA